MTILNSMFKFLNFWLVCILAHQKPIRSRVVGHRIMVSGLAKSYFLMLRKILSLGHLLTIKQDSFKLPVNFCHDKIRCYFFKFRFSNAPI